MRKQYAPLGVLALFGLALAQATCTFTINGKPAQLETLEKNGTGYVEAVSFAKLLCASVTFDQNKRSLVIVTSGQNAVGDVQGTTQFAGGEGTLTKTYSLGKTYNALNFMLTSLEYSLVPVTTGTNEIYNANLKPAQKVDLYRFDLRGKVKPLAPPFANPADGSGASALSEIPAQPGEVYPTLSLGIKLESVNFSKDKMDGKLPAEGKRYLVATFTIKNIVSASVQPIGFNAGRFKIELRDVEGDKQTFNGYLIKVSRDEHAQRSLKSGEEYRFRAYFTLPGDLAPQTLSIAERESHVYVFDVLTAQ